MADFTDAQRRDILMLRGLNKTYDEIAAFLNNRYGTNVSGATVGRVIRGMEDEAAETSPREVFDSVVLNGYVSDLVQGQLNQ